MKIAVRSDYALRAIFELAKNYGRPSLEASEIAREQVIPKRYLEQLLILLKKAGLINSFRGKKGGYSLAKPAETITILNVVEAVDGKLDLLPKEKRKKKNDPIGEVWLKAETGLIETLSATTLKDLVTKQRQKEKISVYMI